MTDLRDSQLGAVGVTGGTAAIGLNDSQLGSIGVASNPAAAGLNVSQLMVIAVTSNAKQFFTLGPVVGLGCWTPCGSLAYQRGN